MRRLALFAVAFAAYLVVIPSAASQSVNPSARVYVSAPSGPAEIAHGQEHTITVRTAFVVENIVCSSEAKVSLTMEVADRPSPLPGVMAHFISAAPEFKIPAGAYQSTAGSVYNQSAESQAMIMVTEEAPGDHAHSFLLSAKFAGGIPPGCQGAGDLPKAEGAAEHRIRIPPKAEEPNPTDITSPTATTAIEPAGKSPGVGPLLLLLAVALGMYRRSRR